jgi:hypothetical protein
MPNDSATILHWAFMRILSLVFAVGEYKPPFPIPETQSAFHLLAQRNAFRRRGVRLQSRSFARSNQSLTRSPKSNRL